MARKPISKLVASKPYVDAAIIAADLSAVEAPPLPAPAEPELPAPVFTNTTARNLHYGDGRRLMPGESAEVPEDLIAIWRGAGFIA